MVDNKKAHGMWLEEVDHSRVIGNCRSNYFWSTNPILTSHFFFIPPTYFENLFFFLNLSIFKMIGTFDDEKLQESKVKWHV